MGRCKPSGLIEIIPSKCTITLGASIVDFAPWIPSRCSLGEAAANCWWLDGHMEKAMAPHASTLAWKIPWMEELGGLQSMGSLKVGHNWATSLSLFTFMHWRRRWQPTPVFLPGESQGQGSLVGCRLRGRTESDTTEVTLAVDGHNILCYWYSRIFSAYKTQRYRCPSFLIISIRQMILYLFILAFRKPNANCEVQWWPNVGPSDPCINSDFSSCLKSVTLLIFLLSSFHFPVIWLYSL